MQATEKAFTFRNGSSEQSEGASQRASDECLIEHLYLLLGCGVFPDFFALQHLDAHAQLTYRLYEDRNQIGVAHAQHMVVSRALGDGFWEVDLTLLSDEADSPLPGQVRLVFKVAGTYGLELRGAILQWPQHVFET